MARNRFRGARRCPASRGAPGIGELVLALMLLSGIAAPQAAQAKQLGQAATQVYLVTNDSGGAIAERAAQIAQMRRQGAQVEIRGACMSACTMYLALPQTCVTRQARLGFHGPSSPSFGIALAPAAFERWSRVMADHYPEPLRSWYLRDGRNQIIGFTEFRGADLIRMGVRECSS